LSVSTPGPFLVTAPGSAQPLRQGEILSGVTQIKVDPATLGTDELGFTAVTHPFAVVLSQDCDLEQDHFVRFPVAQSSDKLIRSVLLCEVATAQELFGAVKSKGGPKAWERVRQNNDLRYHFLQKVEVGADRLNDGLPELAIDFKQYFTLPTDELYRRIDLREAIRRCVLASPYLEHLCRRFTDYLSRVALPLGHASE
jgi:hypothetical protein